MDSVFHFTRERNCRKTREAFAPSLWSSNGIRFVAATQELKKVDITSYLESTEEVADQAFYEPRAVKSNAIDAA